MPGLYFFEPVTIVLDDTKPRVQFWCPCRIVSGEVVLVEHLHAGREDLALKWHNHSKKKVIECKKIFNVHTSNQVRVRATW